MTTCEKCGGTYANGYTRCPECASAAPQDAEAVARARELEHSRLLAEAIIKHLGHDTRAMSELLHHANMRVEFARAAVAQSVLGTRIGYAVWDAGSPTLMPDADPSVSDGEFIKPTPEAARETIQWLSGPERATAEVVAVHRLGGSDV